MVIVDPAVTAQRVYMYFYFAINLGSLGGILTTILEHKVAFWAAYTPPVGMFIIALCIVIWGKRKYVLRKPTGSVILDAFRAYKIAWKHGRDLEFAKPSRATVPVTWDDQFIDELKRALIACKVSPL